MKSPGKLILSIIIMLILGFMFVMVWGKSSRVAYANHLYKSSEYTKAQNIYEDLAIDLPRSPQIFHNIGLALFQQGDYQNAVLNIQKSTKELEKLKKNKNKSTQAGIIFYNLGTSQFKAGFQNENNPDTAIKMYQDAIANYKKVLESNPQDLQAKYNYEITWLHLKAIMSRPPENKQEEVENLLNNTQNSDQFKAKIIPDDSPQNGKDW